MLKGPCMLFQATLYTTPWDNVSSHSWPPATLNEF